MTVESFNWSLGGKSSGTLADGTNIGGGFTQDTGSVDVTFGVVSSAYTPCTTFENNAQKVHSISSGSETVNECSSMQSLLNQKGECANYAFEFSSAVQNVSFRINDIDHDSSVLVYAYDADGNKIPVHITSGSQVAQYDSDGVAGNEYLVGSGSGSDTNPAASALVNIAGPVARLEIVHWQDGDHNSAINVTDIFFDASAANGDGTVDGTDGDDIMVVGYVDDQGDTIDGDDGDDDIIAGYTGNDDITGGAGDDEIFGGSGDDVLAGGSGENTLTGGTGDDRFVGGDGADTFIGNAGQDNLDYRGSNEGVTVDLTNGTLSGGDADNDSYGGGIDGAYGSDHDDVLIGFDNSSTNPDDAYTNEFFGGDGNDYIDGKGGDDILEGGAGNDTIIGGAGDDMISGGDGQDTLKAGAGDVVDGGAGPVDFDVLDLTGQGDYRVVNTSTDSNGNGIDGTIEFLDSSGAVTGTLEFTEIESIIGDNTNPDGVVDGTDGDDDMGPGYVDENGDTIDGADGPDDVINGNGGDDSITAGAGNDVVDGGDGNDTIDSTDGSGPGLPDGTAGEDPSDDLDTVYGGAGNDTIFTGDDKDTVFGGEGNDVIDSGIDDDVVDGGDGNDVITAGDGNDEVDGGEGDDVIDTSGPNSSGADAAPDAGLDIPFPYDQIVPDVAPDADPNDDLDTVYGGAGNDSISTGDDRDTIEGGTGNDTIDSGIDDDSIDGGEGDDSIIAGHGSDIVIGGAGDDNIDAGEDFLSDYAGDTIGIPFADPNPDDGKDTVFGGDGNDTIKTGDDADEIYGGADNDSIDGGIDDDYIEGGSGDDNIEGGHGSDEIYGGEGNDVINAAESEIPQGGIGQVPDSTDPEPGNGTDLVFGGAGDDTIYGGDDDDVLHGDEGSDYLEGGLDEDTLFGGANDDVILVGHGDEAYGGAGDDYFSIDPATGNLGDILIDGGETDENDGDTTKSGGDTLDLSALYDAGAVDTGSLVITDPDPSTPGGGQTGYLFLNDGTRIDFTGIEEFICFTKGTKILTATGERSIETLKVGDKIVTKDHGLQELRWMGSRKVLAAGKMAPIMIKAGAMGNDTDLKVSPQHRMLIEGWKSEMLFGEAEVLAAAKHLVNGETIYEQRGGEVEYFHMLFDTHEIVFANGAASESFHPGEEGFGALAEEAREEVLAIFPELRSDVAAYGAAARTSLKGHEAKVLADNPDFLR